MFSLSTNPLDAAALSRHLDNHSAGAFVCFEGRVRNHNEGREVCALEYEAFDELACKEGARILAEAISRFELTGCLAVHRVGNLQIGETAVWVGVSAAHRAAAFQACRFIIDEIKHRVPIWKRERYVDGSVEWVNCAQCADNSPGSAKPHQSSPGRPFI